MGIFDQLHVQWKQQSVKCGNNQSSHTVVENQHTFSEGEATKIGVTLEREKSVDAEYVNNRQRVTH